jgi:hypothetical protein
MRPRDPRTTMGYTNLEFFDIIDALDASSAFGKYFSP